MRKLRTVAAIGFAATVVMLGTGVVAAEAVGPHQHAVNNPAGSHDIARGFCNGNFLAGEPQNVAIDNFHFMIHLGTRGPDGVVTVGAHGC